MNKWMLDLLSLIANATMTEVPQGDGGTASGEGAQKGTANAGDNTGAGGVGTEASAPGAASPKTGKIEDTVFYAGVDPRDPDKRLLGSQVREAIHRAEQVDQFQGDLHKAQNAHKELQAEIDILRESNEDMKMRQRLQDIAGLQTGGQQTGVGDGSQSGTSRSAADDPWGLGGLGNEQPPAQDQQVQPMNVSQIADLVRGIIQDENKRQFGNVDEQVNTRVDSTVSALEDDRQVREMTTQTFKRSNDEFAQKLRNISVDETEVQRILQMHNSSFEGMKEAELLLSDKGPNREYSRQQALIVIAESNKLRQEVAEAHSEALIAFKAENRRQEAINLSKTPHAGVDVSEYTDTEIRSRQHFNPQEADTANKAATEKAIKIVEEQNRLRNVAGGV